MIHNIPMDVFAIVEGFGEILDVIGVIIIVFGVVLSSIVFLKDWLKGINIRDSYRNYRQNLGRGILLGLEILVAGDIVRTVSGNPTFASIGILALIVLIRTFLNITFQMEVDGRWPWQREKK